MPTSRLSLLLVLLCVGATTRSAAVTNGAERAESVAPGKFIPTFAVKYGGTSGWPTREEAARFDLLDVSASVGHSRVFASEHGNTWQTLKRLNPHMLVFLYQNGPCMYNTAAWGQLGEGWEWIKAEHGIGSADRWIAMGARHGGYLQHKPYPNERLMYVGNRNWLNFWLDETYANFWSGTAAFAAGADGVFADNSGYDLSGGWYLEDQPESEDQPVEYVRDGQYRPELYREDMKQFYTLAVPRFRDRGVKLVANFGNMARAPRVWEELDNEPHPPFAAMEEGAFVHPWGTLGRQGNFVYWSEKEWLNQVDTMRNLKQVRALMNVHGPVVSDATDIRRMDASDAAGNRAWDVLWYAMTSFLQGIDDGRQNAYMNFTVWGYTRFYWLDEFDPQYLHLGRAQGPFRRVDGVDGYVYLREFDDGWAVANPTKSDVTAIPVPGGGNAPVLSHDTFRQADRQPLVDRFDLATHRGVILLKPGKMVGNEDNG
ncbi:MAG TPA: putative glycoside hydrolase [Thermoguttaceae bacterium]|nr:putative glycoside hydrolase [Thermoguttaceae bacterium]